MVRGVPLVAAVLTCVVVAAPLAATPTSAAAPAAGSDLLVRAPSGPPPWPQP